MWLPGECGDGCFASSSPKPAPQPAAAYRATGSGQRYARHAVFVIPRVGGGVRACHAGLRVAVGVVRVRGAWYRRELVRRVVAVRRDAQRTEPVSDRVIGVTFCRSRAPRHAGELIENIVGVVAGSARGLRCTRSAVSRVMDRISRAVQSGRTALAQNTLRPRQIVVSIDRLQT